MGNLLVSVPLRLRIFRKITKGAVAVEAAVVIPILLVLAMVLVDVGRYYFLMISLKSSTVEVARALSLRMPPTLIDGLIAKTTRNLAQLATADSEASLQQSYTQCPMDRTSIEDVAQARLGTQFNWLTPLSLLSGEERPLPISLSVTSEMVCG